MCYYRYGIKTYLILVTFFLQAFNYEDFINNNELFFKIKVNIN